MIKKRTPIITERGPYKRVNIKSVAIDVTTIKYVPASPSLYNGKKKAAYTSALPGSGWGIIISAGIAIIRSARSWLFVVLILVWMSLKYFATASAVACLLHTSPSPRD